MGLGFVLGVCLGFSLGIFLCGFSICYGCVYALFYVMLESLDILELLVQWWQQHRSFSGGVVECGSHGLWALRCGLVMVARWWHGRGGSGVWHPLWVLVGVRWWV